MSANDPKRTFPSEIDAKLDAIERYLKKSGYSAATEELRPVNETRMRARWLLGQALAKVERGQGARTDLTSSQSGTKFRDFLKSLDLNKNRAQEMQRIGTLPEPDLESAFASVREREVLLTTSELI